MKRDDVKTHIPGITDEALNWLMNENGADINREKAKADAEAAAANKPIEVDVVRKEKKSRPHKKN